MQDGAPLLESPEEDLTAKFPYMAKVIRASKLIGMWPCERNGNSLLYHLFVWAVIINNVSFILSFCIQIRSEYRNMDSVAVLIDFVTVFVSGTFRYLYIYVRGNKLKGLVSIIHSRFVRCPFFLRERKVTLERHYRLANLLILTYGTFTFCWIIQICSVPIISYVWALSHQSLGSNQTEPEHVPYPVAMKVYAPFDYYRQPANALFNVYQFVGFMIFGYIYIVVDAFWFLVLFLTMGQLVMIEESLRAVAEHLSGSGAEGDVELWGRGEVERVEAGLRKCIKHHQFVREFIILVEELNNPIVLVDSLHAAISIGFILLDVTISLNMRDINKFMYSLEYLTTSIVHMFFFDWLANKLSENEEKLAEAAYEVSWYKCPSQKVPLLLLMIQSRRPGRLTGGKMYQLSLGFFTSMLRAVFSYFTFLFQLRYDAPK